MVFNLLGVTYTSVSNLQGLSLLNLCWVCDQIAVIYKYFTYINALYISFSSETVYFCLRLLPLAKTSRMLVYL